MEAAARPREDPFQLVGTVIDRRFRLVRVAGAGGFGVVYEAEHQGLGRRVAVKVMRPRGAGDADSWADEVLSFLEEAKALAKVQHPAVVGVLDAGVTYVDGAPGGVPWIALEWIDGETLEVALARRRGQGGRSPREALTLLRPVLEAMAEAHRHGILHRDLKAGNIMLTSGPGPAVRVLDFGIAKLLGEDAGAPGGYTTTQTRSRAFSPVCAAPEQLSGTRTGPWTDVYALGLLLTEVLTDEPAYPVDDANLRLAAVFDTQRPTPARKGVDVGRWESVLARALSIHPKERQAHAGELLAELEAALLEPSATLAAAGAPEREGPAAAGRPRPRRSLPRFVAVAAFGVLLGAGAWVLRAEGPLRGGGSARPRSGEPPATRGLSALRPEENGAPCGDRSGCPPGAHACSPRTGRCVALASPDCEVLADDRALERGDTLWVGSVFPLTGPEADDFGRSNAHAVELARRELTDMHRGLPAARPLGVVSCNDSERGARAAEHLATAGVVPAVIGFRSGVEAIELASTWFIPHGVLSFSATSTNPLLTRLPHPPGVPRLVFRTTYSSAATAEALAAFTAPAVEARRTPGARRREPLRLALVRPASAVGAAFAVALSTALTAEGYATTDEARYLDATFDADGPGAEASYGRTLEALRRLMPDVVYFAGGRSAVVGILRELERGWPPRAGHRPLYMSLAPIGSNLLELVGDDGERRRRVFGVTTAGNPAVGARFLRRYREAFPEDAVSRTSAPDTAYDAMYAAVYASYAVPAAEPVTGAALSRALRRLGPGGPTVEVGLVGVFDAFRVLSGGGTIDLVGASGPLDLDDATGEAPSDQVILCVARGPDGRLEGREAGVVYRTAERRLAEDLRCP